MRDPGVRRRERAALPFPPHDAAARRHHQLEPALGHLPAERGFTEHGARRHQMGRWASRTRQDFRVCFVRDHLLRPVFAPRSRYSVRSKLCGEDSDPTPRPCCGGGCCRSRPSGSILAVLLLLPCSNRLKSTPAIPPQLSCVSLAPWPPLTHLSPEEELEPLEQALAALFLPPRSVVGEDVLTQREAARNNKTRTFNEHRKMG